jgi:hypothetical protein
LTETDEEDDDIINTDYAGLVAKGHRMREFEEDRKQ